MRVTDPRIQSIKGWLRDELKLPVAAIEPASSDASFRRYFRVAAGGRSFIVMDAPPDREDVRPFIRIAALMADIGIHVPAVHRHNLALGFLLLDDLGSRCYLDALTEANADAYYQDALAALCQLQTRLDPDRCGLPGYDEALLRKELALFPEWFLRGLLDLDLSQAAEILKPVEDCLVASALSQPRVCVHRDFHSRNLMVTEHDNPGVLDFQDAVVGPLTYDLVSLLRDCYIDWPEHRINTWLELYRDRLVATGLTLTMGIDEFRRGFDLMGMQRHLKAIGIFSRLHLRDGKPGYLADIPRTMGYVRTVCERYPELAAFAAYIEAELLGPLTAWEAFRR